MTKNKGFLQVGLAVLVASVLVAGFLIQKVSFDQASAALPGTCTCKKANGTNAGGGKCNGTSCDCGDNFEKSNACGQKAPGSGTSESTNPETIGCSPSSGVVTRAGDRYYYCGGCVDRCVREDELPGGCGAYVSAHCNSAGQGSCSSITGGYNIYYCEGENANFNGCQRHDTLPAGVGFDSTNHLIQGHFCGVVQVDGSGGYCSRYDSTGCHNTDNPPPVITPPPTPVITPSPSPTPAPSRSPSPTPTRSPSPTPVCTPTPSRSPSPSPTLVPQCNSFCVSDSQCLTGSTCFWGRCRNPSCKTSNSCTCSSPTPSPSPRPSASPTNTPSPTATPIAQGKLKICKYNDLNNNGHVDNNEKTMAWNFIYKYQDSEHKVGSAWWNVFDHGCREVSVPANQWVNVREEYKNEWTQTGVYQDGNWVGNSDYNYIAQSNVLKNVTFLNHFEEKSTPAPTASGTPNWCNGTCGSNYNCQGGLFCHNGYCRNPSCSSDASCGCGIIATPTPTAPQVVLGATAPPQLPKTGADPLTLAVGLVGLSGTGFWIFKKFRLV